RTFHGRDIFAPVAARLAQGMDPEETQDMDPEEVGEPVDDYVRGAFERPRRAGEGVWHGTVLHIDRFGNVVTNFHRDDFAMLECAGFRLFVEGGEITTIADAYAAREAGELFAIWGSSEYLEVSLNQASAAARLGCAPGSQVELKLALP